MFRKINERLVQIMGLNEPFGGLNVIVVGDLNQLSPVMDTWVFQNTRTTKANGLDYSLLCTNFLWNNFKLFELNEIMRQKDDALFAQALNRLGNYGSLGLSDEQIKMFDSRIIENSSSMSYPHDAIILNHSNANVDKFNRQKILEMPGEVCECKSINIAVGSANDSNGAINLVANCSKRSDINKTMGLPLTIQFKLGCKYMITNNLRTEDGLVNGAVGVLRKMIFESDERLRERPKVKRIYLEFDEKVNDIEGSIGKLTRNEESSVKYRRKDQIDKDNQHWTMLKWEQQTIEYSKGKQYHIERLQFPVIECESMTIYKSQGQTYVSVCVNIGGNLKRSLLYVAMSRATNLNGLYLFGAKSILSDSIRNISKKQKEAEIEKREKSDDVRKEMKRLREESLFKNAFESLDLIGSNRQHKQCRQGENRIFCLFQNIQHFNPKRDILRKDFSYLSMDVILLTEAHNLTQYKYQAEHLFDNFELIHFSSAISRQASSGQLCFVNKRIRDNFKFVADNCDIQTNHTYKDDKNIVEMSLFKLTNNCSVDKRKSVYIISLYKHTSLAFGDFLKKFKDFLNKFANVLSTSLLLILGDFNVDFNKEKEKINCTNWLTWAWNHCSRKRSLSKKVPNWTGHL